MVTVTYGYKDGYLNDCNVEGGKAQGGIDAVDAEQTILYGDVLDIQGVWDDNGVEWVSVDYIVPDISSDVYTHYVVRWRTEDATSPGVGAQAYLTFNVNDQHLLHVAGCPQFDTSWHVTSGTVTPGETIKKITFVANDEPDDYGNGVSDTKHVYFDFALLCQGAFTFPNVRRGPIHHLPPRYAHLPIPGRHGDVTQNLGSPLSWVELGVDLAHPSIADWMRTGPLTVDTTPGQIFEDLAFGAVEEPWQWLTTDRWRMKATLEEPRIDYSEGQRLVDLVFREYRGFDAAHESHVERWGLNL